MYQDMACMRKKYAALVLIYHCFIDFGSIFETGESFQWSNWLHLSCLNGSKAGKMVWSGKQLINLVVHCWSWEKWKCILSHCIVLLLGGWKVGWHHSWCVLHLIARIYFRGCYFWCCPVRDIVQKLPGTALLSTTLCKSSFSKLNAYSDLAWSFALKNRITFKMQ